VEELRVSIDNIDRVVTEDQNQDQNYVLWRRFYEHFPSVKVLQAGETSSSHTPPSFIARTLLQDCGEPDGPAFLPALEEIDLGGSSVFESERESQLATFQPFTSAREKAGCPVKVFYTPYL
jgi:hypothetical protein